jgi:hypothetical protein
MCLACEQEAMWFAYLRRRGLITPDGQFVEAPPSLFVAESGDPAELVAQAESDQRVAPAEADQQKSSRDDPSAG